MKIEKINMAEVRASAQKVRDDRKAVSAEHEKAEHDKLARQEEKLRLKKEKEMRRTANAIAENAVKKILEAASQGRESVSVHTLKHSNWGLPTSSGWKQLRRQRPFPHRRWDDMELEDVSAHLRAQEEVTADWSTIAWSIAKVRMVRPSQRKVLLRGVGLLVYQTLQEHGIDCAVTVEETTSYVEDSDVGGHIRAHYPVYVAKARLVVAL